MAGIISSDKIKELQDAFNLFADNRGLIRTKTMELILKHIGESPAKEEVQEMINQVDVDGAGFIRFPEFLKMMAERVCVFYLHHQSFF